MKHFIWKRTPLYEIYFGGEIYKKWNSLRSERKKLEGEISHVETENNKAMKMKVNERSTVERPLLCFVTQNAEFLVTNPKTRRFSANLKTSLSMLILAAFWK